MKQNTDHDLPELGSGVVFALEGFTYLLLDGKLYKSRRRDSDEYARQLVANPTRGQREAVLGTVFRSDFGTKGPIGSVATGAACILLAHALAAKAGRKAIVGMHLLTDPMRGGHFVLDLDYNRKDGFGVFLYEQSAYACPLTVVRKPLAERMDVARALLSWGKAILEKAALRKTRKEAKA